MNHSGFSKREIVGMIIGGFLSALGVIYLFDVTGLGEWLAGVSDSFWWEALPWVLLALFWAAIGYWSYERGDSNDAHGGEPAGS